MPDFILDSLSGGYDDSSPVTKLAKDAAPVAQNVEFWRSTCGERRAGTESEDLPVGLTGNPAIVGITWNFAWNPGEGDTTAEQWVLAWERSGLAYVNPVMWRKTAAGWFAVAFPSANDKPLGASIADAFNIHAVAFRGKLFLAYKSTVDRLHVWDGTSLRRVGLPPNAVPTAANQGGGAYPATQRWVRTRSVLRSGTTVLVRSEPSPSVAFTPSGAAASARYTRAALPGEFETDWEVEVSTDNVTFYKIATVAAATTFYDDTALVATYSASPQSAPLNSHVVPPSARYLTVDADRLILASNYGIGSFNSADSCAVRWTPVGNDELPGPDERLDNNSKPRIDLDNLNGGIITGVSNAINGTTVVHKKQQVFRLARTGSLIGAYEAVPLTKARGAYPRSIVNAYDEAGKECHYAIDPSSGPYRVGGSAIQYLGRQVQKLFKRINLGAYQPVHGVFHADKQQVWWWLALDTALTPNCLVKLQVDRIQADDRGDGIGGWSVSATTDRAAFAWTSTMFAAEIDPLVGSGSNARLLPYTAGSYGTVGSQSVGPLITDMLQRCDTGTTDCGTAYTAKLKSRMFFLANILNKHGINGGSVMVTANGQTSGGILVKLYKDFGVTVVQSVRASFDTAVGGPYPIVSLSELTASSLFAVQIALEDDPLVDTQWEVYMVALAEAPEDRMAL